MKTMKLLLAGLSQTLQDEESVFFIKRNLPLISLTCLALVVMGMALGFIINV
jgi:hypothetical protein